MYIYRLEYLYVQTGLPRRAAISRRGRRQGRAGAGWKLVRAAILLADLDVEVVALGVLGVDVHAGERVARRVEQLRMVVATGVGAVIGRLP